MKPNKLLHVVVVLGASLTGGLPAAGCGGGTTLDANAAKDAAADSPSGAYGRISIDAAYGNIAVDAGYGRIMPAPLDSGIDNALDAAPADAEPSDANEAG